MARAAYLMDKLMVRVGLSGKSFIPLLSSFACAIPGRDGHAGDREPPRPADDDSGGAADELLGPVAGLRAVDRGVHSAAEISGAALLRLQGLTLFAMYLVGIVTAVVVALILKQTLLRGPTPPFVMELPPYKMPSVKIVVLHRMLERGWAFIMRAGTLIVAVAIVVWALLYYPHNPDGRRPTICTPAGESLEHQLAAMRFDSPRRCAQRREFPSSRSLARCNDPEEQVKLGRRRLPAAQLVGPHGPTGSSRPCVRWVGIGGSAARPSPRSRRAKSCSARWA